MRWLRPVAIALVAGGLLLLAGGLWMPAKAALAQVLLRQAWSQPRGEPVRPWPWARTWPVARLTVPSLGIDRIVLEGDQGAALAFAPGHVDGTAAPGEDGNIVLAGHRDTVFSFLGKLELGDELRLESAGGALRTYVITDTAVIHENNTTILEPTDEPTLTLVTCYPLDGTRPGGPLRYVVSASVTNDPSAPPFMGERARQTANCGSGTASGYRAISGAAESNHGDSPAIASSRTAYRPAKTLSSSRCMKSVVSTREMASAFTALGRARDTTTTMVAAEALVARRMKGDFTYGFRDLGARRLIYAVAARFSRSTPGCRAAIRRRARAGPSGVRRPCSQLRRVWTLIPSA